MLSKLSLLSLVLLLALMPLAGAQAQEELPTIAEIAAGDENFSILVEALTQADLVETFAGEGEFTVFAPTNAAFEALPPGMLDGVLSSPPSLAAVLGYHVLEGAFLAEDIAEMPSLPTLMGAPLAVTVNEDGSITLNGTVNVVTADIQASNGVVHVIDAVLVPERPGQGADEAPAEEAGNTIADVVARTESLAFLNTALSLAPAGLVAALQDSEAQFILFAPSDAAFTALDEDLRNAAIADPALLGSILLLHVAPYDGMPIEAVIGFLASQTEPFGIASLLPEAPLGLSLNEEGGLLVNEILTGEIIEADNGLVVVIEGLLLPTDEQVLTAEALAELLPAPEAAEEGMGDESGMEMPEGPILDENWEAVASGFGMDELDTADDFFVTVLDPFAAGADNELYGAEIINWTADYRYTGFIVEQFLPGEVLLWMAEQDPTLWETLSDSVLSKLPAEELAKLPAEVQARVQ